MSSSSDTPSISVWKFWIGADEILPHPTVANLSHSGKLCVVVADSEIRARARVREYAEKNQYDARWLDAARVEKIAVKSGYVVAWVEI